MLAVGAATMDLISPPGSAPFRPNVAAPLAAAFPAPEPGP
jgi:hypothetical protein